MDEDREKFLKRFGFLPKIECSETGGDQPRMGEEVESKVHRYYLAENEGVYLTVREAEVSWHISRGRTVRESAGQMELSPRTVEFYLANVRRKLGVRNKGELIKVLFESRFFQNFVVEEEKEKSS